jgi:riboflavin synthase
MFSGITEGLYPIIALKREPGLINYTVNLSKELCIGLRTGDSIAIDGVCQTVVKCIGTHVSFQAIQETLDKTTLNEMKNGDYVSVEPSVRIGEALGGHEVSGHVFGTALIQQKIETLNNLTLVIQCNPSWMKYILPKGFIAVDGSSLTIGETDSEQGLFSLHLIPETLKLTKFSQKKVHDKVNLEFDQKTKTIVDTVERLLPSLTK